MYKSAFVGFSKVTQGLVYWQFESWAELREGKQFCFCKHTFTVALLPPLPSLQIMLDFEVLILEG